MTKTISAVTPRTFPKPAGFSYGYEVKHGRLVFISGQVYEFTTFYHEGLGYTTNLFGSAFYTMTGFHGIHVTVGIVMLMSLFIKSLRGNLTKENAETVEIIGYLNEVAS